MKLLYLTSHYGNFSISDFSKKKSVHSINSLWFIAGLVFVTSGMNFSSMIINHVPELTDKVSGKDV